MYHASILDSDIYKFSMQAALCKMYPRVFSRYKFINRNSREFPNDFAKRLRQIVDSFRAISLTKAEKDFMTERCYYLNPVYLDFLAGYRYDPKEVAITQVEDSLDVMIMGPSYRTVLWEVPLMATISELYFEMTGQTCWSEDKRHATNLFKAKTFAEMDVYYSEFGTRRRYSYKIQDEVVNDLKQYGDGHMLGTSNVHLAMKHDLIPMGTVAHEWYSLHAAMYGFKMANDTANEAWVNVYNGDLGTALPDTFTTDAFLKSFNTKYAKLFDGMRQDSGNPLVFLDKCVAHYKKLRINPQLKMLMFSDNLNSFKKIKEIHDACNGKVIDRYGIGTWLTNDLMTEELGQNITAIKPLNMVIKLIAVNFAGEWVNTIKLSDDPKKYTGDPETINLCKQTLGIK
jgi:nicotinate phosphoribosyltransferase